MSAEASRMQSQHFKGQIHSQAGRLTKTLGALETPPSRYPALGTCPVLAGDRCHPCTEIPPDLLVGKRVGTTVAVINSLGQTRTLERRRSLPKATQSPAPTVIQSGEPPGIKNPSAPGGRVRVQLIEKHGGLFLTKSILYLRLLVSSGSYSRVSAQLRPKTGSLGDPAMSQTIYLGWVPGCHPWGSEWPLRPCWAHLMPLHTPCASGGGPPPPPAGPTRRNASTQPHSRRTSTLGRGGGNQGRLPKGSDPELSLRAEA